MGVHIAVDHTADGYMLLENGVMTATFRCSSMQPKIASVMTPTEYITKHNDDDDDITCKKQWKMV